MRVIIDKTLKWTLRLILTTTTSSSKSSITHARSRSSSNRRSRSRSSSYNNSMVTSAADTPITHKCPSQWPCSTQTPTKSFDCSKTLTKQAHRSTSNIDKSVHAATRSESRLMDSNGNFIKDLPPSMNVSIYTYMHYSEMKIESLYT